MSQTFNAIYENGILRLNQPLNLPENTPVVGVLNQSAQVANFSREQQTAQQEALARLRSKVSQLPQTPATDGLSGRDHDAILYGEAQ